MGDSTGKFETATSGDFSHDAEAAFDFLRQHPRVDPHRIGLIGHSEGGIVAPMVAARRDEVAWIVLLAGTGVDGREILLSQGELVLRAEGIVQEEDLKVQAPFRRRDLPRCSSPNPTLTSSNSFSGRSTRSAKRSRPCSLRPSNLRLRLAEISAK